MTDRERDHDEMTPELIIECAPIFLKAYYEIQRDLFQHRLDNFDRVNWASLKQTLAGQLSLPAVQQLGTGSSVDTLMRKALQWIEGCVTD